MVTESERFDSLLKTANLQLDESIRFADKCDFERTIWRFKDYSRAFHALYDVEGFPTLNAKRGDPLNKLKLKEGKVVVNLHKRCKAK